MYEHHNTRWCAALPALLARHRDRAVGITPRCARDSFACLWPPTGHFPGSGRPPASNKANVIAHAAFTPPGTNVENNNNTDSFTFPGGSFLVTLKYTVESEHLNKAAYLLTEKLRLRSLRWLTSLLTCTLGLLTEAGQGHLSPAARARDTS